MANTKLKLKTPEVDDVKLVSMGFTWRTELKPVDPEDPSQGQKEVTVTLLQTVTEDSANNRTTNRVVWDTFQVEQALEDEAVALDRIKEKALAIHIQRHYE